MKNQIRKALHIFSVMWVLISIGFLIFFLLEDWRAAAGTFFDTAIKVALAMLFIWLTKNIYSKLRSGMKK